VRGSNGCSGGFRGYGSCDGLAAGGNLRGVGMGVGSGGGHERNGEEGGRGGIRLIDRLMGACRIKESSDPKKLSKQKRITIQCAII